MPAPAIEGMSWRDFLDWFGPMWQPGQHVPIIAPTGEGKTTVLCGILGLRKYVLGFDPKGGDETLESLISRGYQRLTSWPPPRRTYEAMARGEPARFLVGPRLQTHLDLPKLKEVQRQALIGAFDQRGWTVAVDELQILADRRMMALGTDVERLLISARTRKVSVVTLFQAPRWVPRAAYDQARWIFVGMTGDTDVVNRLGEILGRPKPEVRGAVEGLASRPYSWLVAPKNPRQPLIVTVPEKVTGRSVDSAAPGG